MTEIICCSTADREIEGTRVYPAFRFDAAKLAEADPIEFNRHLHRRGIEGMAPLGEVQEKSLSRLASEAKERASEKNQAHVKKDKPKGQEPDR